MISNIHTNCMGTASFFGKFGKMRKEQNFVVYPIQSDSDTNRLPIQSGNRYGIITIDNGVGKLVLSAAHSYANNMSLQLDIIRNKAEDVLIPSDVLAPLLDHIRKTSSPMAGNNGIMYSDNSKAHLV